MNGAVDTSASPRRGPLRLLKDPLTWRSAAFLLLHAPLGLAYFVGLAVLLSVSVGTVVIWVGVLGLALTMILWRGAAVFERRLAHLAFGVRIPSPYRALPSGRNLLRKWRTLAADPATWKDLVYLLLAFPIGVAEFMISMVLWVMTVALLTMPIWITQSRGGYLYVTFAGHEIWLDDPLTTLPAVPLGIGAFVVAMYAVRIVGAAHAAIASYLLGPSETQALRARTAQLRASRARGVDAAEAERRRIERDLHDGAQQRLLAVAMDLGRARAKLETDPVAAQELIQQAHAGAKEAIAELRDLARGIYPAILTDRGLDAAISAVAARAPMPVQVEIDLPTRPPAAVESIAYFIVSEALANVAKYARATRASVSITRDQTWVIVEVSDNGVGGAEATPGGGLAGLADRAAGIDGILTVNSPIGGPTVIRADLPCVW
ncbi:sensor domain-containing protein [Actinoallomurus spadix]|uniref:histidine kinase n=1 Tax=Actinoallomurus spadix TaxID=79912 RepID=A0ABP3FHW4_9ACTN|nr:sensor domain-containing protein [Actinoallomurus spadix]MCO5990069.1 sensor domain-containing protein [Actinoallomurus spadix]